MPTCQGEVQGESPVCSAPVRGVAPAAASIVSRGGSAVTGGAEPSRVPRVPSSVAERARLFDRLEAHAGSPLVVLRAPAGGGKTTLLVDWLARSPRPGAWLTVDSANGRRLAFWQRTIGALVRSDALPRDSILRSVTGGEDLGQSLRTTLLSGLSDLPTRLLLVLDDFQHVHDAQVAEDLSWLLSSGAALDLVVASRAPTPFERPEQLARIDTLVLGPADLAFDAEEMLMVGRQAGISDRDALAIHEASGGLPLAARATVLELASHPGWTASEAIARVQGDWATHLVADETEPSYRAFLLHLSIAASAGRDLIHRLTGPGATEHLERAEYEGVGSWTDGPDGRMFALQPYLRVRLLTELQRLEPHEVRGLQEIYGHDLAARGDLIGAIRQLAAAGAWDAVTRVLLSGYGELLQVHAVELGEVLASAGSSVLRRHPVLLVALVLLDNSRKALPRTTLIHKANLGIALLQARLGGGDARDRAPLLAALLAAQRLGGHYDSALDTSERLLALIATSDDNAREALLSLRATVFVQVATTYFYAQQVDRADDLFRAAIEIAIEERRPWVELHASSMRLMLRSMRGRVDPAELDAIRDRARPLHWRGTYAATGYHLAEASEALENFDADAARGHLDELAPHEHTLEHWPLVARLRGIAALVEGKPYLGLERLVADVTAHEDRPPISRLMSTLLTVARADLLLADGEPQRAEAALRSVRRAPAAAFARGRVLLSLGHYQEAIGEVAPFAWSESSFPRTKAEALLVIAVAAAKLGREADAKHAIGRALDLLADAGLRRPLMMVPRSELSAVLTLAGRDPATVLDGIPDVFGSDHSAATLTSSELRVLEELRVSGSTEDIAGALFLSVNTVKSHQRTIYRKLGVRTREAALAVATLRGIIDGGSEPPALPRPASRPAKP